MKKDDHEDKCRRKYNSLRQKIDAMIARCETETDWIRAAATTPEDVARQIAEDPELAVPANWKETIRAGLLPPPLTDENKRQVTIRLDAAVVEFFKAGGRGWQSRINALLSSYIRQIHSDGR